MAQEEKGQLEEGEGQLEEGRRRRRGEGEEKEEKDNGFVEVGHSFSYNSYFSYNRTLRTTSHHFAQLRALLKPAIESALVEPKAPTSQPLHIAM